MRTKLKQMGSKINITLTDNKKNPKESKPSRLAEKIKEIDALSHCTI